ncbi:MAG: cytochrome C, partial [Planctomycetia bacterium]|nr:cytochrome C [Planctomycetia bacterium]
MLRFIGLLCQLLLVFVVAKSAYAQTAIPDTQNPKDKLSTPEEALKSVKLPPGFKAQMFAHEPEVIQPVNMSFDSRGRLWVSECLTYAESKTNFDLTLKDRIVILEDTDNDGVHDKRTVFWDQGHHLTSALPGFGGVWALCAPNLLFIPDRNGDDKPDGEPEIILNGFDNNSIRHNIVNGLAWGPDGWLYGRHGITTTSFVGTPDTPASKRIPINCGV